MLYYKINIEDNLINCLLFLLIEKAGELYIIYFIGILSGISRFISNKLMEIIL